MLKYWENAQSIFGGDSPITGQLPNWPDAFLPKDPGGWSPAGPHTWGTEQWQYIVAYYEALGKLPDEVMRFSEWADYALNKLKEFGVKVPGYQHGGSFVVPSGYPNDSYLMGVSSGERVTVQRRDERRDGPGTVNNLNIYTNAEVTSDIPDILLLRAWSNG